MDITCYTHSFFTTDSLPMMPGPKPQALSYLVPTKYLFLPNSLTQTSEIPFFTSVACLRQATVLVMLAFIA